MGQIQSGINQLFTTVGVMARLSPDLVAKAEKRAALKDLDRKTAVATEQQALTRAESTKAFREAVNLEPEKFEGLSEAEQNLKLDAAQVMSNKKNEEDIFNSGYPPYGGHRICPASTLGWRIN